MNQDSPIDRIEGRIVDWFFTDGPITALVVVRIGLGLVAFCSTLEYLPHVHWLWSEHGFLAETLVSYQVHPLRFHTELVFAAILLSSAFLTIGLATRASGLVAALSMAVLGSSGYSHTWGWSTVMPAVLAIVALSPARNGWSVDAWWAARRGRWLPTVAPDGRCVCCRCTSRSCIWRPAGTASTTGAGSTVRWCMRRLPMACTRAFHMSTPSRSSPFFGY